MPYIAKLLDFMSEITHEISLDQFHHQITWVLNGYRAHGLKAGQFKNVVIGGLGGSGIGGRIAKLAVFTAFPVPVEVYSEYRLPAYAGSDTLVILSSYSGNTEETLSMYQDAKSRGCRIICLSSGGQLAASAFADGCPCYPVEAGYQPRMALGYSLTTLLLILGELGGFDFKSSLEKAAAALQANAGLKQEAEFICRHFSDGLNYKFVVICDTVLEAVSVRFCQQIQENAKGEAFVTVIPEANHNVIESYYGRHDTHFLLLNSGLNARNDARFEFLKTVLRETGNRFHEIPSAPFTIERVFSLIHILDWVSIGISNAKGVNNMRVDNIARLKAYLETV